VANLLNLLIAERTVVVEAPAWLEVVLMRQPGRTLVHLVNGHGNRPVDRNNVCVEQALPVRGVSVALRWAQRPALVTLEPGGVRPEWQYADGLLVVRVPEVDVHCAIAVA